jgi:hypothetical protein
MRYPKHPFSPDEPAADARAGPPDDRYDIPRGAVPGRDGRTSPPSPHRTGDAGFRPYDQRGPAAEDSWAAADPRGSWPLAPRPQPEPLDSWAHEDPQLAWADDPPQDGTQDSSVPVDPQEAWPPSAPADEPQEPGAAEGTYRPAWPTDAPVADEPVERPEAGDRQQAWSDGAAPSGDTQDPWAYADPQAYRLPEAPREVAPGEGWRYRDPGDSWAAEGAGRGRSGEPCDHEGPDAAPPTETPAQGEVQETWADSDAEGSWDPARAQQYWVPAPPDHADPDTGWAGPGPQQDWAPAPPEQAEQPRESWRPPERPPAAPDEPWLRAPAQPRRRVRGWAGRKAARYRGEPSPAELAAAEPPADRMAAGSRGSAEPGAGPVPASMGFQDLWESWEPPRDPVGPASGRTAQPTAPYPEFVRDAEYEADLWEFPGAAGGAGDGGPPRGRQHTRTIRRPRRGGGAFLALAAALVIAAGVPIGMLAARTLAHHGDRTLKTAPQSASRASGSARAATFSALAGPGCPAVTSATVFPYHPPDGDGWYPATASGSGPCGSSFVFSYLAMIPGNPGEWRDDYAWVFRTGMANPSCTFSLWIPAAQQANSDVYYWFSAGSTDPNDRIADFTIDQATHRGEWVTHGPFTFPGGTALIEATDRGEGPLTASVAVGPARLSC